MYPDNAPGSPELIGVRMIRTPLFAVQLLVLLAVADPDGARADEPTSNIEASNVFVAPTPPTTTAETIIAQIVEAGREQLAAACVAYPGASVRIFNPLASGDHADVPCSMILDGGESLGQSSEALTSGGEHIGQTQQWGIISTVACFAGGAAAFFGTRYGICNYQGGAKAGERATERDRANCNDVGGWGGLGIGFICALTAIIPF
jgi:hypothetical protein